jgi:hypothetical protein
MRRQPQHRAALWSLGLTTFSLFFIHFHRPEHSPLLWSSW